MNDRSPWAAPTPPTRSLAWPAPQGGRIPVRLGEDVPDRDGWYRYDAKTSVTRNRQTGEYERANNRTGEIVARGPVLDLVAPPRPTAFKVKPKEVKKPKGYRAKKHNTIPLNLRKRMAKKRAAKTIARVTLREKQGASSFYRRFSGTGGKRVQLTDWRSKNNGHIARCPGSQGRGVGYIRTSGCPGCKAMDPRRSKGSGFRR